MEMTFLLTRGLDSECWGEERTSMGMPRAGLVPEPLLPANWPQGSRQECINKREREKAELLFRTPCETIQAQWECEGEDVAFKFKRFEATQMQCVYSLKFIERDLHVIYFVSLYSPHNNHLFFALSLFLQKKQKLKKGANQISWFRYLWTRQLHIDKTSRPKIGKKLQSRLSCSWTLGLCAVANKPTTVKEKA